MKLPPILQKKMAGLPTWAWLALAATGVGVGLILRSRNGEDESEVSEDPCDPEGPAYDPVKCEAVGDTELSAGYDTGDPCDPTSVTYDPAACQATAGIGYQSAGGGGGPSGYTQEPYEPYPSEAPEPMAPTASELGTAEEGGIDTGAPLVQITQNIRTASRGCDKKHKPKNKKGYKVVCANGHWSFEPNKHAAKKNRRGQHDKLTGGGAPHKRNNKGKGHGKKRKHKVKH